MAKKRVAKRAEAQSDESQSDESQSDDTELDDDVEADDDDDDDGDDAEADDEDEAGESKRSPWLSRRVLIALAAGIAIGGGGGFLAGQKYRTRRRPRAKGGPAYVPLAEWNPRKGPAAAKVTIIEFSDFQ